MKLSFNIEYRTKWGEQVMLLGDIPELGGGDENKAIPLSTKNGVDWEGVAEVNSIKGQIISYRYLIVCEGNVVRREYTIPERQLQLPTANGVNLRIKNYWNDLFENQHMYTSAFTDVIMSHNNRTKYTVKPEASFILNVYAPMVDDNHIVAISGNQKILGEWDASKALELSDANFPSWSIQIPLKDLHFPIEYKYLLKDKNTGRVIQWEMSPNRYIPNPMLKEKESFVEADEKAFFASSDWKGAGVAIPVFSLRSEESYGVGDFGDIKKMVDWVEKTGQKVLQILPINDTTITGTWTDSYPYNSISIYAFHPMYLNLKALGRLSNKKLMAKFEAEQKVVNSLDKVDYEKVNKIKWEYIKEAFKEIGDKQLSSKEFKEFFKANERWLKPYAAFSYLRDKFGTPCFTKWTEYSIYDSQEVDKLANGKAMKDIQLYYFVQYNLHRQLLEASRYARSKGVVLKGDIPIGISRDSVEAWTEPHYFNLNGQAGAPPDDFSVNGQNWGFPTYNWEEMAKDGYAWWMRRFKKMSEYFDAYRIDHILGFFRIWEIPMDAVHGLLGQFSPAQPMSKEEIESYGINFREDFFTKPYIHEYFLGDLFGKHTSYVKQTFIETTDVWEVYRMRPEFDTQKKVEEFFKGKTDDDSIWIRDGLYALISNVLFVRDRNNRDMYHPRISVQHDFIYQALNDSEKAGFNRLYDNYFYHRHNEFWKEQAMRKLPQLIQSTRMLVCGEDLGMIPSCVPDVMNELKILSLEIQRMPKDPKMTFGFPQAYPYRSVCTFSTHDMSTLRGWWKEDYAVTQRFYNEMLGQEWSAPKDITPELCETVIWQQMESRSLLAILSLQDWMSMCEDMRIEVPEEERINVPANPRHYWRYRMNKTIEELINNEYFNNKIKSIIRNTGR